MNLNSIPEMFYLTCCRYPRNRPAFKFKVKGSYVEIGYGELWEKIEQFSISIKSLGIKAEDRVGIISENRIEWVITDIGLSTIRAISVPLFPTTTSKQIKYIFNDCSASAVFVSSKFQLNKLLEARKNIPTLRQVIVFDEIDLNEFNDPTIKTFSFIMSYGKNLFTLEKRKNFIIGEINQVHPDDIHTIIYTSGTTGDPKGVILTHNNILSNIDGSLRSINFTENDIFLSFLPWCHSYERTTGYYSAFYTGGLIALAESIDTIAINIKEIKPTFMTTVPRLLEIVKKKIFAQMSRENFAKQKIFNWAINTGKEYIKNKLDGKTNYLKKIQFALANKLVFTKIREKIGVDNITFVSGGAPLNPEVNLFFWTLGFRVFEGYGLTEASPVVSVTREDNVEIGTVGQPLPNVEVKVCEDGEILVRGPNVMKGYWNDSKATAEVIDEDGWLYTGDIGYITEKGNLKITDRKKHIFVTSGGKNIAPQYVENLIAQSHFVDQCILIGDNREFNTALIIPNFEELERLAKNLNINYNTFSELVSNQTVVKIIKNDIDRLQKDLSKFERIRKFAILTESFSVDNEELTPKLSIRRHVVERKYSNIIESMYKINDE
ncbi:MAG: AMP-dependent synthetase/ligase [Candidatus Kapaibacteriales bacterium]